MRTVEATSAAAALAEALQGGPPIAPLPVDASERRRTLEMLRPDEPIERPGLAAVVATSGSTGEPKGVLLSRSAIAVSVAATHQHLGGAGDWVLALPAHYVAGMMVMARTLLGGTTLHEVPSDLTGLPAAVRAMRGRRYLSLVPTQLFRACGEIELSQTLSQFDAVLIGGAPAGSDLLERARSQGIRVVTTYGMSETCGGCVYDGVPLAGVEVRLEPETGRVVLGGPQLFSGYRLRPDLTRAALGSGRLVTADRGEWRGDRLRLLGRMDDVVISGGVTVDLAAVERAARAWPGLHGAEVAVVGVPDAEWGTRVVAVLEEPASATGLRDYLRRALTAWSVPRDVTKVTTLPRTSGGKIDRQRIVGLVADRQPVQPVQPVQPSVRPDDQKGKQP